MLLGDREFCSKHLATWLLEIGWGYCLRLKKTTYVQLDNDELMTLNQLALVPGISIFLRGVNISKTVHKFPFNVAVHYPKEHHGMPIEEGWFLLTTFSDLNTAVQIYATRFQLEEMFRDFKLYGFNPHSALQLLRHRLVTKTRQFDDTTDRNSLIAMTQN